ncbi:MAG: hypothetical protein ACR2KM_02115 [Gemmatimonadaceae bacterium]
MDELEARFDLLKAEMSELQQAIRSQDTITLQAKGWAVTVGLAAAGLALSAKVSIAALLGLLSSAAFWSIDAHRRTPRAANQTSSEIEDALNAGTVAEALNSPTRLAVPNIAHHLTHPTNRARAHVEILKQSLSPDTALLYVVLAAVLVVVAVVA